MGTVQFEDILKEIGKHGRYQLLVTLLTGAGMFMVGFHTLANVFLSGVPEFWCDGCSGPDSQLNHTDISGALGRSNRSFNNDTTDVCQDPCGLGKGNDSDPGTCSRWKYDPSVYGKTVVSTWDLVCTSGWMVALGQSTYMLGFTVGGISLGNVSDVFGRKTVWLASMVLLLLSAVGAAFMPSYWAFIAFRSLSGVAVAGVNTAGFVLITEITGSKGRMFGDFAYQGSFALGYMVLTGVAYVIRDYKYLQLFSGLTVLLFIPFFWILDESARWLMTKGRYSEADTIISKAARMNQRELSVNVCDNEQDSLINKEKTDSKEATTAYSFLTVLKYPRLRWRCLNVCFNWFVNSFVFYGLSLGSAGFLGGPHLNLFLSGVMEFPAFFISAFTLTRIGRQKTEVMFLLTGGICCVIISFLPEDLDLLVVVLSLVGKLCIAGSFCVIYMYTAELFPTVVRNIAVGGGCTFARVGGSVAPFILFLGQFWRPLPMLCFGAVSVTAGLLAFALPETLNQKLPDTLIEGEEFGKDNRASTCERWTMCKK